MAKTPCIQCRGLGSILGQGTRSHMHGGEKWKKGEILSDAKKRARSRNLQTRSEGGKTIYIYTHMFICVCLCVYIYIYLFTYT